MKKTLYHTILGLVVIFVLTSSFPVPKGNHQLKHKQPTAPQTVSGFLRVDDILNLSTNDFAQLKGEKLSLADKLNFKLTQLELKKNVKQGKISRDEKMSYSSLNRAPGFSFGAFALGFLLGLIGVLLVYAFGKKPEGPKSAWIGFGIWVLLFVLFLL